jgi:heparin/heparan-sulfate lyase
LEPSTGSVPLSQSDDLENWLPQLRQGHPRLFFNCETWPAVRVRALGVAADAWERLIEKVKGYPDEPEGDSGGPAFEREQKIAGQAFMMPTVKGSTEWGVQAMETAFVYLVSGEAQFLEKARRMLEVSVEVYHQCYRDRRVVNWYCMSRVCAIAAYDWICNDLTGGQRRAILAPLLRHVEDIQPAPDKPVIFGINDSDHKTGFYGVKNIPWFAGLAGYGDGIEDELAGRLLQTGYEHYSQMLNFREACALDDGGLASTTTGYALGAYSWASFNIFHTWKSAFGEDLAPHWPHMALFPNWILWNWIPADEHPLEFGSGDTYHGDNQLRTYALYEHMSQIMHFHGQSHPRCAALAAHIRNIVPENPGPTSWPVYPFLLTELENAPAPEPQDDSQPAARHFEGMGQIIMRSGNGPDATRCLFTVAGHAINHRHYDENNFIIYKKGFLALDTGTRAQSTDFQLRHYYAQTVAHNCILIHMPGEPQPSYWGPAYEGPEGKENYGGMIRRGLGELLAFETNPHYTYIASDGTACYSEEKCELALRQFVFIPPAHFVILDRVTSTDPNYRKTWLLHTQNEPQVTANTFHCDEGDGRLFCQALLPERAALTPIGGPGKEFWANGRNWELNEEFKVGQQEFQEKTGKAMLLGNWRMEVSPAEPSREDIFLHLIQVGDSGLANISSAEASRSDERVAVSFRAGEQDVSITFNITDQTSGRIAIRGTPVELGQELATGVMPQSGLD